jgi:hypothetical protein
MTNITNPLGAAKTLDFNTFERLAKDSQVDNKATVHIATQTGGRVVVGLEAKTPIAGKKINLLGKPISDLSKATDAQRNGILATQAFKQALVQRYGETIANAVDKHLLQSGQAKILTAEDLRKNLKVADAIVRILKQTPQPAKHNHELSNSSSRRNQDGSPIEPSAAKETSSTRNHGLSNSSSRRNEDGSPAEPSAPPRSRSSSSSSESSVNAYFRNREQPPAYRSTEDLRPSAPPLPNPKEVSEIDEAGNQWHHNPLFVNTDDALEIAGESASLPEDPEAAKAAQRPRAKALSQDELEASFKDFEDLLKESTNPTKKT